MGFPRVTVPVDLPVGIQIDGRIYHRAVLAPISMRASLRAAAASTTPPEGVSAEEWRGLARIAAHVDSLDDLPGSRVTAELLLDSCDQDVTALTDGLGRLAEAARAFRGDGGGVPSSGVSGGEGHGVA